MFFNCENKQGINIFNAIKLSNTKKKTQMPF